MELRGRTGARASLRPAPKRTRGEVIKEKLTAVLCAVPVACLAGRYALSAYGAGSVTCVMVAMWVLWKHDGRFEARNRGRCYAG